MSVVHDQITLGFPAHTSSRAIVEQSLKHDWGVSLSVCAGGRAGEKAGRQNAEELNQHERTEGASSCKLLTQ